MELKVKSKEELVKLKENLESKVNWSRAKIQKIEDELNNRESKKLNFVRYEGR